MTPLVLLEPDLLPAPSSALPERLRLETRDLHVRSERTGVMAGLLRGHIDRPHYSALLRNLHAIYEAMEAAPVAGLVPPPLHRARALADDLRALNGEHWRRSLPLQPATQAYVARLHALAADDSPARVAHAYVRYLGDLHGGQALKRLVAQHLGLPPGQGVAFYEFGDDAAVLARRTAFCSALAGWRVTPAEADLIVAEARWGFEQHIALFTELAS